MTKATADVSTCFVFKSSPETFIPSFFSKIHLPWEGGITPDPPSRPPAPVEER